MKGTKKPVKGGKKPNGGGKQPSPEALKMLGNC